MGEGVAHIRTSQKLIGVGPVARQRGTQLAKPFVNVLADAALPQAPACAGPRTGGVVLAGHGLGSEGSPINLAWCAAWWSWRAEQAAKDQHTLAEIAMCSEARLTLANFLQCGKREWSVQVLVSSRLHGKTGCPLHVARKDRSRKLWSQRPVAMRAPYLYRPRPDISTTPHHRIG